MDFLPLQREDAPGIGWSSSQPTTRLTRRAKRSGKDLFGGSFFLYKIIQIFAYMKKFL